MPAMTKDGIEFWVTYEVNRSELPSAILALVEEKVREAADAMFARWSGEGTTNGARELMVEQIVARVMGR